MIGQIITSKSLSALIVVLMLFSSVLSPSIVNAQQVAETQQSESKAPLAGGIAGAIPGAALGFGAGFIATLLIAPWGGAAALIAIAILPTLAGALAGYFAGSRIVKWWQNRRSRNEVPRLEQPGASSEPSLSVDGVTISDTGSSDTSQPAARDSSATVEQEIVRAGDIDTDTLQAAQERYIKAYEAYRDAVASADEDAVRAVIEEYLAAQRAYEALR